MSNETEKMTINLGVVELAQIDVLVELGIYSNRSDFIRTAIRKQLDECKDSIELSLTPISTKRETTKVIGILSLSKKELERLHRENEKLSLSIIGMLIIDKDIDADLFRETVDHVTLRGKMIASEEIKRIIEDMK